MKYRFYCATFLALTIFITGCGYSPMNYDMTDCVALNNIELQRLRNAWNSTGAQHDVVAAKISKLDEYMARGLNIPQEGGQHNQWYQCDACQMHLETVDPQHHKCPKCHKVYSGWPYDNVLYNHSHHSNAANIHDAALAYVITDEDKYRQFATDLMTGYAELYKTLPRIVNYTKDRPAYNRDGVTPARSGGYVSNQTLNESMLMVDIASGLDILCHAGAISPEDLDKINAGLIRPMITSICGHRADKSNWQTWHNAAMVYASATLKDKALLDRALNDPGNGFNEQMKISVLGDGMWYETSWGYHFYTLKAMTSIAEGARRLGVNLYDRPELKSMYMAVLDYIMPDDTLPRFGDVTQSRSYSFPMGDEAAYAVYKDPAQASLLADEPNWYSVLHGRDTSEKIERPDPVSVIKHHAGHAILRSEKDNNQSAAVLVFGPYGGFHGHFDKLSFIYISGDDSVAIDHGCAKSQAYRLPIHKQWYKATISHNTIMLDSQDQEGIQAKFLQSELGDPQGYSAAAIAAPGIFKEKASFTRFVMTYGDSLVVVDQIKSLDGESHRIDWLCHSEAEAASSDLVEAGDSLGLPDCEGVGYLQNAKAYQLDGNTARAAFVKSGSVLARAAIAVAGADETTLITADGPFASVLERAALVDLAMTGKDVIVAAVISTGANAAKPVILSDTEKLSVKVDFAADEKCVINFKDGDINQGFSVEIF